MAPTLFQCSSHCQIPSLSCCALSCHSIVFCIRIQSFQSIIFCNEFGKFGFLLKSRRSFAIPSSCPLESISALCIPHATISRPPVDAPVQPPRNTSLCIGECDPICISFTITCSLPLISMHTHLYGVVQHPQTPIP